MDVLLGSAAPGSSLCLLGPGHLNDVDLPTLLGHCAKVHLVDIDVTAVRAALRRQGVSESPACRVHGPIDLTGVLDRLPTSPDSEAGLVDELLDTLARENDAVAGLRCDVTASTGVLTQLLQSVGDSSLSPGDKVRVSLAVRDKHLADLVGLTRAGGTMALITDVVSTGTAPWLLETPPATLGDELAGLVEARNFFTGTNPFRIVAVLEESERFRDLVAETRLLEPWLWKVTNDRQHLTYAILARRRAGSPGQALEDSGVD
jgi:hypothetical protein